MDILHRAKGFPSVSTSYAFVRSQKSKVTCPPGATVETAISNVELIDSAVEGSGNIPFFSLKMDSTYGDKRARWIPVDNIVYGLCFEHTAPVKLQFDFIEDIEKIAKLVNEDKVHIPKELFVLGISGLAEKSLFMPAIIWPTCSHKNEELQKDIISSAIIATESKFGNLNVCSDGDSNRRRIFTSMMSKDGCKDPRLGKYLEKMPLLNKEVGISNVTSNYDAKGSAMLEYLRRRSSGIHASSRKVI